MFAFKSLFFSFSFFVIFSTSNSSELIWFRLSWSLFLTIVSYCFFLLLSLSLSLALCHLICFKKRKRIENREERERERLCVACQMIDDLLYSLKFKFDFCKRLRLNAKLLSIGQFAFVAFCLLLLVFVEMSASKTSRSSCPTRQWDVRLFGTSKQILGEGPFYDRINQRFYQVDIKGKKVIRFDLRHDVSLSVQFPHESRAFANVVSFVIPLRAPNSSLILIGVRNQIIIYNFDLESVVRQLDFSHLLRRKLFSFLLFRSFSNDLDTHHSQRTL